jgi:hypothetical protein
MIMAYEEAGDVCREMAEDTGLTGTLAVHAVIRDLIQLSHNSSSPLVQVEAIEILIALDPEGWAEAWESMPDDLKAEARQVVETQKRQHETQQS